MFNKKSNTPLTVLSVKQFLAILKENTPKQENAAPTEKQYASQTKSNSRKF